MISASVTIDAGSGPAPAVAFSERPDIFKANLNNGCTTVEGFDYFFPNPGPDADVTSVGTKKDGQLSGNCGAAGSSSSSGPSPVPANSAPAKGPAPATDAIADGKATATQVTNPTTVITIAIPTSTNATPSATGLAPAVGQRTSTNGECSGTTTCKGSTFGRCCSKWGYCGATTEHCGTGCQSAFGECGIQAKLRGRHWK